MKNMPVLERRKTRFLNDLLEVGEVGLEVRRETGEE
jgi:hypothetical protein